MLGGWEWVVRVHDIPPYVLPGPVLIAETLVRDWTPLSASLLVTLKITALALLVAASLGLLLAVLFAQSRVVELSLFPYAVILQVTPIVAIAPLIIIWVNDITLSLLICAWIVAFFPILSNTTVGLNSTDHNLLDLFRLYRASRWQVLWRLRLPSAMPYFLSGLRISGGLALIGAIVAESSPAPAAAPRGSPTASSKPATSCRFPHVRRAGAGLGHRHRHLPGTQLGVAPAAAALARKRHGAWGAAMSRVMQALRAAVAAG
ncbi:ABC transporter permease [Siccirubricoccus deserti]